MQPTTAAKNRKTKNADDGANPGVSDPHANLHTMIHPWRELRNREDITLHWASLPPPLHAITDGTTVWMHDRLLQVERRCAITHEQIHIDRGTTCVDQREETRVRALTAQRLIPLPDLIRALQWAHDLHEAADELWVTPTVLQDRLTHLTPTERQATHDALTDQ